MSANSTTSTPASPGLDRNGIRRFIQLAVGMLLYAILLFVPAGTIRWLWGWVYLGMWALSIAVAGIVMMRKNPDLINERGKKHEDQKPWDKTIIRIYTPISFLALILAAFDAVRFGWSSMPLWLHLVGLAISVFAGFMAYWAMGTNPFTSAVVRIQDDRGHYVYTEGPYKYVRHPMYVGTTLMWVAMPLLLGSWWTFVPAALSIALFIIRIIFEERTLHEELPGYTEYTQTVRYRLIPGIW